MSVSRSDVSPAGPARSNASERERIHPLFLDDAKRGLADIAAGRTCEAEMAIIQLQQRRAAVAASG